MGVPAKNKWLPWSIYFPSMVLELVAQRKLQVTAKDVPILKLFSVLAKAPALYY